MLKIYYLRQLKDKVTGTEYTEGQEFISHAICETTEKLDVRRVIIEENANLASLALKVEEPTERDLENYKTLPQPTISRDLFAELDELKSELAKQRAGVDKHV